MFRLIGRHFKEAFQGIRRHFAMAVSSATAVTITLLLVSLLTIIIGNVSQITRNIEKEIRIYVSIEKEVPDADIPSLQRSIEAIEGVASVEYSDADNELELYIKEMGEEGEKYFGSYRENNPLKRVFYITVSPGFSFTGIEKQVSAINGISEVEFGGSTTEDFLKMLSGLRTGGYAIVLALTLLSIFNISNTIKITIYNRKDEIGIMRQVGASNSYIRQPFVIEGVFIGLLGACIPVAATIFGYRYLYESFHGQLVSGMLVLLPENPFIYEVCGFLGLVGVVVGLIGSFMSVNKYLRWTR